MEELSERFPTLLQKLDEASRPYVEWAKGEPEALRKLPGRLATARPTFKEAAAYFDLDPKKLDREAYWQRSEARRNAAGDDVRTLLEVIRHGSVIDDAVRGPRPELSQREASEINSLLARYSPGL